MVVEGKIEINNSRESARKELIGNYNLEKSEFCILLLRLFFAKFLKLNWDPDLH